MITRARATATAKLTTSTTSTAIATSIIDNNDDNGENNVSNELDSQNDPCSYVGKRMCKYFNNPKNKKEIRLYFGTISKYDKKRKLWRIDYDPVEDEEDEDDDWEELYIEELSEVLKLYEELETKVAGASNNSNNTTRPMQYQEPVTMIQEDDRDSPKNNTADTTLTMPRHEPVSVNRDNNICENQGTAVPYLFIGNLLSECSIQSIVNIFHEPQTIVASFKCKDAVQPVEVGCVDMRRNYCFVHFQGVSTAIEIEQILSYCWSIKGKYLEGVSNSLNIEIARGDGLVKKREDERRKYITPSETLFVGNINIKARSEELLKVFFGKFGTVIRFELMRNYAVVQFSTVAEATAAKEACVDLVVDYSLLDVNYYFYKDPKQGGIHCVENSCWDNRQLIQHHHHQSNQNRPRSTQSLCSGSAGNDRRSYDRTSGTSHGPIQHHYHQSNQRCLQSNQRCLQSNPNRPGVLCASCDSRSGTSHQPIQHRYHQPNQHFLQSNENRPRLPQQFCSSSAGNDCGGAPFWWGTN